MPRFICDGACARGMRTLSSSALCSRHARSRCEPYSHHETHNHKCDASTIIPFSFTHSLYVLSIRITHVIASSPFNSVQLWWRQGRNLLARIRGAAALRVLLQRLSWLLQHAKRNGWIRFTSSQARCMGWSRLDQRLPSRHCVHRGQKPPQDLSHSPRKQNAPSILQQVLHSNL